MTVVPERRHYLGFAAFWKRQAPVSKVRLRGVAAELVGSWLQTERPAQTEMEEDYTPLALEAVLLFHSGSPWDDDKRLRWTEICSRVKLPPERSTHVAYEDGWSATTKCLCDIVRAAIAQRESWAK